MAEWFFLDSGPLGLAYKDRSIPKVDQFLTWFEARASRVRFCVAAVTDYEVRRELLRERGKNKAQLRGLDLFLRRVVRVPVKDDAWIAACRFWGDVRRRGLPTGDDRDIDGDAILAGVAATFGRPGDTTVIVTENLRHYGRFRAINARQWSDLV